MPASLAPVRERAQSPLGPYDYWDNSSVGADGKYDDDTPDDWPDCLNRLPHTDPTHPNGELDGNLRDYVSNISLIFGNPDNCQLEELDAADPAGSKLPEEKQVERIFHGILIDDGDYGAKCVYAVKLLAPPCADSFNPFTDPKGGDAETIDCHFVDNESDDPQEWERFADIGDDLKVQVTYHSLRGE